MFEDCSVFVLLDDNAVMVKKLEADRETQEQIGRIFAEACGRLTEGKEKVLFDGNYSPDEDEYLQIEGFRMEEAVTKAVDKPVNVLPFYPQKESAENIKAVFVGESGDGGCIAFQRLRRDQFISPRRLNLIFDRNTFVTERRFGISIADCVDCVYRGGGLAFSSYYFARQIFDLSGYYRAATQGEVESFTKVRGLAMEDGEAFLQQADSTVRRKIASIMDSRVLEHYSAEEIKRTGKKEGVKIEIRDGSIVIPSDKKKMKVVLGFLDEAVYKGVFTKNTYIANSKRTLKKKKN